MNVQKGTIAYIGGFELPDKNAAAQRVIPLAKILKAHGYNVVFLSVDRQLNNNKIKKNNILGFDCYQVKYPKTTIEWVQYLYCFKRQKRILNNIDELKGIIAYNMHSAPLKKLLHYSKKEKIKLISDITEWYENSFSFNLRRLIKWIDTNAVMKKWNKRVDAIISISDYITNYYSTNLMPIIQIPPLVDINDDKWRESSGELSDNKVSFVYAGQPGNNKDRLDIIVKVFQHLADKYYFTFKIVGITLDEYENTFGPFNHDTILDRIVFEGKKSHKDIIQLLFKSDYCIFFRNPTRKNNAGFPTKFVECVTSGVGVITNKFSNIAEYFPIENSFILDSIDEDLIFDTIEQAIKNGKVNHKINTTFDLNNYSHSLCNFIDEIIGSKEN